MKEPALTDRTVKVRAYLTDEVFGYDHWRAAQYCGPVNAKPAILLVFDAESERDAVMQDLAVWPPWRISR